MQFYHDIITQKSFNYLQDLKKKHDFILIGGWAVFLYSHAIKSKDIDIIISYSELAKMKEMYDLVKNERLRKYEIKIGEFDIDVYLCHFSFVLQSEWFVLGVVDPYAVAHICEPTSHGNHSTFLRVLTATLSELEAPGSQITVGTKRPEDVVPRID